MWPVDYYAILEIRPSASPAEIRRAYRARAKEHHPDRNPDDDDAEGRFKRVAAAYSVLGDPQERARYDAARCRRGGQASPSVTLRRAPVRQSETVEFPCPNPGCGQRLRVAPCDLDASLRCPVCGHRFRAGGDVGGGAEAQTFHAGGQRVVVSQRWIVLGGERIRARDVRGIRYGAVRDPWVGRRCVGVWLTDGRRQAGVECDEETFGPLTDALLAAVRRPILERMVRALESGRGFEIGEVLFDGYGLHRFGAPGGTHHAFSRWTASLLGGPADELLDLHATHLAWEELGSYRVAGDRLVLSDRHGSRWTTFSLRDDWNAVLLPALLAALTAA
jgi:predicted RNA-binding Zn-ribbon protein involved in translation (DUF1610 family)